MYSLRFSRLLRLMPAALGPVAVAALALAGHAGTAAAATFDAVADFSLASNPNKAWSYGTLDSIPGGTFTPFATAESNVEFTGQQIWDNGGSPPNRAAVVRNTTDMTVTTGTVVDRPGQLRIDGENFIVDVRWTAPAAGTYRVTGFFQRADTSPAPVTVRVIQNRTKVLFVSENFADNGVQRTFDLANVSLAAGATLDFTENAGQFNNDGTGLSVTISTEVPTSPALHLVNASGQGAAEVINSGAAFVTSYRAPNDVTIQKLAGSVQPVYIDNYGGTTAGNNPSYLTNFVGSTETGTGDGTVGGFRLLDTNQGPPNVALQFDFKQPLTGADRILIADVDTTEKYQIQAYRRVNDAYQALPLAKWNHEQFSGRTGDNPTAAFATWNPADGTLTSNAGGGNLNEPLDVFTPDQPVDRLVLTKLDGDSGDAGFQIVGVKGLAPVITSALSASGTVGKAFEYHITASNGPASYGASGLPAGLTINQTTGVISGTPTAAGTFAVTIAAFNNVGSGSAKLMLTIAAPAAESPKITSVLTASGTVGKPFEYHITASNSPTKYGASGLPAGLTVNQTTGVISGTPTAAGMYAVTIAAFNATGSGSAKLALTIAAATAESPRITSPLTASGTVGKPFEYHITASNSPAKYGAASLPPGLTVNQTTGVISGTPTAADHYTVTIAAFNNVGSGSAKLALTISAAAAESPKITSPLTASGTVGKPFEYHITASNSPASYGASGLPPGLTINQTTGVISGTPTAADHYTVTIAAFNATGSGSAKLALTVAASTAEVPVITSSHDPASRQGVAFAYQITATNNPTSFGASELPAGLTINEATGKISGTPTKAGTYSVTITASNNAGHGSATLTLVVKTPA